jgi:hypothetical protein
MEMGELMAYQHDGFWSCCDHLADKRRLEAMWAAGDRPWATWADAANADKLIGALRGARASLSSSPTIPVSAAAATPVNGCATARSEASRRHTAQDRCRHTMERCGTAITKLVPAARSSFNCSMISADRFQGRIRT